MRRRMTTLFSGTLLVAAALIARPAVNQAQGAQPVSLAPAVVQQAVGFAISRPLGSLPPDVATTTGPDQDRPRVRIIPNREIPRDGVPVDEDLMVQQMMPVPNVMPGVGLSFAGLANSDNLAAFGFQVNPPDTVGDVGPGHYVQQTNLLVRVFNKAGAPLAAPIKLSTLFAPLGGLCAAGDSGDPIVLYDPLADRWLLSQFRFVNPSTPPYHECIAISRTSDPAGTYFLYDFITPGNNMPDYPHLGVWPDGYYMTTNQFLFGGPFNGSGAFAFERAKMLVGDGTAAMLYFDLGLSHPEICCILPADLDGVSAPPAGAPNVMAYFTANEFGDPSDAIRLFNFHADFAVPANSTFLERAGSPLGVAAFNPISPSGQDDIPQPPPSGGSSMLDAISDRLLHRLQYRNRGGFESLVVNHTVDADAAPGAFRAGVRYYELRNGAPGGVYAVNEQSTFSPDATHRWMASAALDHQGNLAVGLSASSAAVFPSIRYAGRLVTDPPNGLFQGEGTLIAGTGVQTTTNSRWGDYSALSLDPVDDCTFWYTTEYYTAASQASSSVGWLTRVGSFKFPSCTARATGTLIVNVTTCSGGTPVQNALVKVNLALWGATGTSGSFTAKLDPGVYNLNAEKSSVGTGSNSATVIAGSTTTSNICLGAAGGTVDLTTSAMSAKGKAAAGASVAVKYTIANSGTSASVATTTHVYLSTNATWDAGDTLIGSDATVPVPAGGSINQVTSASIFPGTAAGVYYLIVFADGGTNQPETNENNNTRSKKISIGPDLVISALSINPGSVAAGGSMTINETTKNKGAQSTGAASTTTWYLSLDKKVNAGDTVLGTHAVPALGPNGTHAKSQAVTIPAGKPPGQYWIIAEVDTANAIDEVKEGGTKAVALTIF
jgi:CARDB